MNSLRARSKWLGLTVLLSVGLIAFTATCRQDGAPRAIVFILLDAARADRVSAYGYDRATTPHIDALADRGTLFRQHFVQSTATRQSLPQLFHSRYFVPPIFPASPRVPLSAPHDLFRTVDAEAVALPRALAAEGFATVAISAHPWLREGTEFDALFQELYDLSSFEGVAGKRPYPLGERVTEFALRWISERRDEDFFLYAHYMDTHFPHFFERDAREFFGSSTVPPDLARRFEDSGWPRHPEMLLTEGERALLDALYDGSLRYADRQVGRVLDGLAEMGLTDTTLVVVTSDHGENLLEVPGRQEHGGPWYDTVGHVPLVISYPGRLEPGVYDGLTEAVDLLPTIASLMDIRLPRSTVFDGTDLTALVKGDLPAKPHVFAIRGVRSASSKVLFEGLRPDQLAARLSGRQPMRSRDLNGELYDLTSDPQETRNLWSEEPFTKRRLLLEYTRTLAPSYRRYQAAHQQSPPESAFAIAAKDFRVKATRPGSIRSDTSVNPQPESWLWSKHWRDYGLAGGSEAQPVAISFPLPSGSYELSAAMTGECVLEVEGHGPRTLVGAPGDSGTAGGESPDELVAYGPVEIGEDSFEATLSVPTGDSPCSLRYFGFSPVGRGSEDDAEDREDLERRLRALGYVQ